MFVSYWHGFKQTSVGLFVTELDLSKLAEEEEVEETEGGETESSPTLPTPPPPLFTNINNFIIMI